jgi:hypothetical protein
MKNASLAIALAVTCYFAPALAQQQPEPKLPRQPTPPPAVPYRAPAQPPIYLAPGHASPSAPGLPSAVAPSITVRQPPPEHSLTDLPGLRHVPSVASLPSMRSRPIIRHVLVGGVSLDVPAIAIVGVPYVIDVPGLGWVYVPEGEYPTLFEMLTSDDTVQVEAGYARLQQFAVGQ